MIGHFQCLLSISPNFHLFLKNFLSGTRRPLHSRPAGPCPPCPPRRYAADRVVTDRNERRATWTGSGEALGPETVCQTDRSAAEGRKHVAAAVIGSGSIWRTSRGPTGSISHPGCSAEPTGYIASQPLNLSLVRSLAGAR